jgi:hypothetical protein
MISNNDGGRIDMKIKEEVLKLTEEDLEDMPDLD